jgi:hypothetical protein
MVERGFDAYVLTGGLSNGSARAAAPPARATGAPKAAPQPKPAGK